MRYLVVPDIHFGGGLSLGKDDPILGYNTKIQDQEDILEFISNYISNKTHSNYIDRVILLGDIWDTPNPKAIVVTKFIEWLKSISAKCRVDIVMGNHDYLRHGQKKISMLYAISAAKMPKVTIHDKITAQQEFTDNFVFFPYTDKDEMEAASAAEAIASIKSKLSCLTLSKYRNILVGHMAIEGAIWVGNEIDNERKELFLPLDTFEGFDYVFMGHIHNQQVLSTNPHIEHVSSVDRQKVGESAKYMLVFDTTTADITRIPIPCKDVANVEIIIPRDIQDATAYVANIINSNKSALANSIVTLSVQTLGEDAMPLDRKAITDLLNTIGVHRCTTVSETKKPQQIVGVNKALSANLEPGKVVEIVASKFDVDGSFRDEVVSVCKDIVTSIKVEE